MFNVMFALHSWMSDVRVTGPAQTSPSSHCCISYQTRAFASLRVTKEAEQQPRQSEMT